MLHNKNHIYIDTEAIKSQFLFFATINFNVLIFIEKNLV